MINDLKWSNYDFTKIPFDDIVSVGKQCYTELLGGHCNYQCR